MSDIQSLRTISGINSLEDMKKAALDFQNNFSILGRQSPQVLDDLPAAGTIRFLAQEEDGSWHTWQLVAGAGATLTPDAVTRVLTLTVP